MVLCLLPPPQGTGACLPRPGLGWTEVRCVQEGHGRQAGPSWHSLCTLNSGVKGRRKEPEASMRICSTLVETMGDPVPGRLKGLVV